MAGLFFLMVGSCSMCTRNTFPLSRGIIGGSVHVIDGDSKPVTGRVIRMLLN